MAGGGQDGDGLAPMDGLSRPDELGLSRLLGLSLGAMLGDALGSVRLGGIVGRLIDGLEDVPEQAANVPARTISRASRFSIA